MSFDKNMTGALFKSASKTPDDNKPNYKGSCVIDGKTYEIAMWRKTSKKGVVFLSLSFQVPRAKQIDDDESY